MDQPAGGQVGGQGAVERLEHRGAASSRRASAQGGWVDVEDLDAPERRSPGSRSSARSPTRSGSGCSSAAGRSGRRAGVRARRRRRTRRAAAGAPERAAARDPDVGHLDRVVRVRGDQRPARVRGPFGEGDRDPGDARCLGDLLAQAFEPADAHRPVAGGRRSPTRSVPAGRVPVTTVPVPRTWKRRSTQSRTSAAGSGGGTSRRTAREGRPQLVEPGAGPAADRPPRGCPPGRCGTARPPPVPGRAPGRRGRCG